MFPTAPASPASAKPDPLEEYLSSLLPSSDLAPQALHRAMRHAVFPGGKRIRPRLLLTVAAACAADEAETELAMHAACAIELIHSASLVHDDLPCFDDARQRRGLPTVHVLYGEPLAVLAGDALLTRAFELMAETPARLARRALRIVRLLGQATGSREGIIGGQSLEQNDLVAPGPARPATPEGPGERRLPGPLGFAPGILDRYHAMKTAALFRLAAEAGAVAAGATDAPAWGEVGQCLGLAYQLADDLCDTFGSEAAAGKPVRRDLDLGRPNAVVVSGEHSTRARLQSLLDQALARTMELAAEPKPLVGLIEELTGHFMRTTA
jgi:geranylgeranyl diphosphate synthase type II